MSDVLLVSCHHVDKNTFIMAFQPSIYASNEHAAHELRYCDHRETCKYSVGSVSGNMSCLRLMLLKVAQGRVYC